MSKENPEEPQNPPHKDGQNPKKTVLEALKAPREIGGFADQNLAEPTRFGDWEVNGRCSDF